MNEEILDNVVSCIQKGKKKEWDVHSWSTFHHRSKQLELTHGQIVKIVKVFNDKEVSVTGESLNY